MGPRLLASLCYFATSLFGQPALGLTEILALRAGAFGTQMSVSPSGRVFVLYGQAIAGEPAGLANSFGVVPADGEVGYADRLVPALIAAVDDDGSAWAAGYASLTDQSATRAHLTKVDASGRIAWSRTIDAHPAAMTLDQLGHLVLAGTASPGSTFAGVPENTAGRVAFLAFLDQDTGEVASMRTLGGNACISPNCDGDTAPRTQATALTVLPDGAVWVAGYTNTRDFAVTAGALRREPASGSWLAKFGATGVPFYASYLHGQNDMPYAFAIGPDGSVHLASRVGSNTAYTKLNATASRIIYDSVLSLGGNTLKLTVDPQDNLLGIWGPFSIYTFWLRPDGTVGGTTSLTTIGLAAATAASGSVYAYGRAQPSSGDPYARDFLYRWTLHEPATPAIRHITSSAGRVLIERVAPGELISIYGSAMGPSPGMASTFDSQGFLPVDFSGTEVFFDGRRAPLLYVNESQVNAVVPFAVAGQEFTSFQVCTHICSSPVNLRVVPAHPNLFTIQDPEVNVPRILAFSSDGVLNTRLDPSRPGSIITVFLSGAGAVNGPIMDGAAGAPGQGVPAMRIRVTVGLFTEVEAEIRYSGSLAGTVNGVVQLNIKLPDMDVGMPRTEHLRVAIGSAIAEGDLYLWNGGR